MPILGENPMGEGAKFLVPSYQGTNKTPLCVKTLTGAASIGCCGQKYAILVQKFGYLGRRVTFLFRNCDFCRQGKSPVYRGLQFSHSANLKKFCFRAMGDFLGFSPVFGHFIPFPLHYCKYP